MIYNKKRHSELLKLEYEKRILSQNKSSENKEEYFELAKYNRVVEDHFFWQKRHQVALLMKNFLNKEIDGKLFCDEIYLLRRKLINTCEKFKLELISNSETVEYFQPDKKSKKISGLLTGLYYECKHFADDSENDEFYISIKNGFLNLQKDLNEE